MIDLHGLYVEEALEYAGLAFESAALEDDKEVRFIVGTSSLWPSRWFLMVDFRRIQARDYMRRMVRPKSGQRWKSSAKSTFGVLYCSHSLFLYSHPGLSYLRRGFTYHLHPKNAGVLIVHC